MDGLKKGMDGMKNGMEAKMDGVEAKMDGVEANMDCIERNMEDLNKYIEGLKEVFEKFLQEKIPNGEKVVEETHDENKRNANHDFIESNVGFKTHHIPNIDMRKFYGKDPMEYLKKYMEGLKEGLERLLQEKIPNGEKVVEETHDENKINVNRDFIKSIVGGKGHHIPKMDMQMFDRKDPVTWIL